MQKVGLLTYRKMVEQARNSEEALLAAHSCCGSTSKRPSVIEWPSDISFRALLGRLDFARPGAVSLSCLSWLDRPQWPAENESRLFDEDELFGHDLRWAFLLSANLSGTNLSGSNLVAANLVYANLHGTDLSHTFLFRANLNGADLSYAKLDGADLGEALLDDVRGLDRASGLKEVENLRGAKIERKWVERLKLDAEKLGLVVVDDLEEGDSEEEQPRADAGSG